MLISDGTWISETCRAITEKSTSQADLERRLSMFTADKLLAWYEPKSKPNEPLALLKYRDMSKDERRKFNKENPDWIMNEEIQEFMKKESSVNVENMSNIWWLTNCLKYDIGDARKEAIQRVLNKYPLHLRRHETQRPHRDEAVESVREMFAGKVEE